MEITTKSSNSKNQSCETMNKEIVTLHDRDTLEMIRLFEKSLKKIAHTSADLNFLKKCRDNRIIPLFTNMKHHL